MNRMSRSWSGDVGVGCVGVFVGVVRGVWVKKKIMCIWMGWLDRLGCSNGMSGLE